MTYIKDLINIAGPQSGVLTVPESVAGRIQVASNLRDDPYLVAPTDPQWTLFAAESSGDFYLNLGDSSEPIDAPTYLDYLDEQGVDTNNRKSITDWQGDNGMEPEEIDMDEKIGRGVYNEWLHWERDTKWRPMAQSYLYLEGLNLADQARGAETGYLGELGFVDGDRLWSNTVILRAPDLAPVACLQERLKEPGDSTAIMIDHQG